MHRDFKGIHFDFYNQTFFIVSSINENFKIKQIKIPDSVDFIAKPFSHIARKYTVLGTSNPLNGLAIGIV